MTILRITLVSSHHNLRHTVLRSSGEARSTPLAHHLCWVVERETNESKEHSKYAPWKILSWDWES